MNRHVFLLLLLIIAGTGCISLKAQPTIVGGSVVNGVLANYDLTDYGSFRQARVQALSSAATNTRTWRFGKGTAAVPDLTTNWRPVTGTCTGHPNALIPDYDETISPAPGSPAPYGSATYNTASGGCNGYLPAVTANNYYTFNITENNASNNYMSVLETSYNPVSISTVTQTPAAGAVTECNYTEVTITLSGTPSANERFFLRYSTSSTFVTSTIVVFTISGTTGTALIPSFTAGTTVYYYAYSSNKTKPFIDGEVSTYGQLAHDMLTLKINNNATLNYSYTTTAAGTNYAGIYYVPSTCYPTFNDFVADVNLGTITGAVTCYVNSGHTETAPSGGMDIYFTGTASNTITIKKYGTGVNPIIYAPLGVITLSNVSGLEGIINLHSVSYITIDGIDLQDNNASEPGTMDYGFAFFKWTAAEGNKYNVIKNCNITLNKVNNATGPGNFGNGSRGIYMANTSKAFPATIFNVTTTAGRNDNNTFTGNTISNVWNGIVLKGSATFAYFDQNNTIGTISEGNTIQHFGNSLSTLTTNGIQFINQDNIAIRGNIISNTAGGGVKCYPEIRGIVDETVNASSVHNIYIEYNQITIEKNASAYNMYGVLIGPTVSSGDCGLIEINNNVFSNLSNESGSTAIGFAIANYTEAETISIKNNYIENYYWYTTSTSSMALVYSLTSGNMFFENNELINNTKNGGSGLLSGYNFSNSIGSSGEEQVNNNIIDGLYTVGAATGKVIGIQSLSGLGVLKVISGNTINDINTGTGTSITITSAINAQYLDNGSEISDNIITNINGYGIIQAINVGAVNDFVTANSRTFTISGNTISGVTNNNTSSIETSGIRFISAALVATVICENNSISNITNNSPGGATFGIRGYGGAAGGEHIIRNNIINNIKHGVNNTATFVYGFNSTAVADVTVDGNSISELTGFTAGDVITALHIQPNAINTVTVKNNFIQNLFNTLSNSSNTIYAMNFSSGFAIPTNVYYNTIALGYPSAISGAGTLFGATGINYSSTVLLILRNNLIYLNVNTGATGVSACVRRAAGTANVAPANLNSSTDNNHYYININAKNFIYYEAGNNGYAWNGVTEIALNNINNDPCFNDLGIDNSSYKYFMSPREANSVFSPISFVGGATIPDNLKQITGVASASESNAQNIAGITTDYFGNIRQGNAGYAGAGTAPDAGAFEGAMIAYDPGCYLLPIELMEFSGTVAEEVDVLSWSTLSEKNISHFNVEHSIDGIHFNIVTTVPAAGNSTEILRYSAINDAPVTGNNFYRLVTAEADGSSVYSDIIVLNRTSNNNTCTVYPNPANSAVTINVSESFLSSTNELLLYNNFGALIMKKTIFIDEDGEIPFVLPAGIIPGTYFIVVQNNLLKAVMPLQVL